MKKMWKKSISYMEKRQIEFIFACYYNNQRSTQAVRTKRGKPSKEILIILRSTNFSLFGFLPCIKAWRTDLVGEK